MTIEPGGRHELEVFDAEIRVALRYERGLVVKALSVLAMLAVLVVLRTLYFALPADRSEGECRWHGE